MVEHPVSGMDDPFSRKGDPVPQFPELCMHSTQGKLEFFPGYLLSRSVSRLLCLASAQGEISTKS